MRRPLLLLTFLAISLSSWAQYDLNMTMPMDPRLKMGRLPNGLTYFIQHNEEPKDRADFYIIYNVGALQEEENQNGLAHFLEHMAFNGSLNFPGGNSERTSIVKTLERHGVAFGRNINAYTSTDRTVYYLNDVATGDSALIDTCLLVLHDWAHYLSLEEDEIDNERGVISEEWRTRNNSASRMRKQWYPMMFGDSKLTTHDVIGSYEIINNFKYDELRDFYYKWYRTDQQAIAVVGDIDVQDIEKRIVGMFSGIPAVENPTPKEKLVFPVYDEPAYALATDKEQKGNSIEVLSVLEKTDDKTIGGKRTQVLRAFYGQAMSNRLNDMVSDGDPDLIGGGSRFSDFLPGYEIFNISCSPLPGHDLKAFEKVYTEVIRAKRYGFTQDEFNRIRLDLMSALDNAYKQKDKTQNKTISGNIVTHFTQGKVLVSMDDLYPIMRFILDSITLEDVNALASQTPVLRNVRIVVMAKDEEGYAYPGREDLLSIMSKVDADAGIKPLVEKKTSGTLVGDIVPGRIVRESKLPFFNAKKWTLSNGATVVFARADYDKDVVSLTASSQGGASVLPVEMLIPGSCVSQAAMTCGVGRFSASELKKALAGKQASVSLNVKENCETVTGSSTIKDFETMMQIAYLRFAEPRFDSVQFYGGLDKVVSLLRMMEGTPETVSGDSLSTILANNSKRFVSIKADKLLSVKLSDVETVYRDRFGSAGDFTFFIVGDIEEDTAREMSAKYIGAIPSDSRKEKCVNHHESLPKGHLAKEIVIPYTTPKASVNLVYKAVTKVDPKSRIKMSILKSVLDLRFTSNIREKEGGTYGVRASMAPQRLPENALTYKIQFDTQIEKAEHLRDLVLAEIESVCTDGITETELENVRKNLLKNREQAKAKNAFIINGLTEYVLYGEDNISEKGYEDILGSIKPRDIRKFAASYFRKADLVDVIFANEFNN